MQNQPAGGIPTVASEVQKAFIPMEWTDAESLRRCLANKAHDEHRKFYRLGGVQ